jgi:pectinesterase
VTRLFIKDSYVEGDTDFIFGRGTVVLDGVTINSLKTKTGGTPLAPSTAAGNPYGFLVVNSTFTAETGLAVNSTYLGRAWDEGAGSGYVPGTSPNGQALVRDSMLGAHIKATTPWTNAATTGRAYSASGNRLYEYKNTGPGAAR